LALEILRKIFIFFSVILLAVIIIFMPLLVNINNCSFYEKLYVKNGVFEYLSQEDARSITKQVMTFFKHHGELEEIELDSDIAYFQENEKSHLLDVRELLDKIYVLFYLSLFGFFLFVILIFKGDLWDYFRKIAVVLISASALVLVLLAVLYILANNFTGLFTDFHLVFFPQGNWAFPNDALIINIFPFGFFYDFFLRLVLSSFVMSVSLLMTGVVFLIIKKKVYLKKERK